MKTSNFYPEPFSQFAVENRPEGKTRIDSKKKDIFLPVCDPRRFSSTGDSLVAVEQASSQDPAVPRPDPGKSLCHLWNNDKRKVSMKVINWR